MIPITFSILVAAACGFLIYVLAQFTRELQYMRKSPNGITRPTEADICRIEAALKSARSRSHAGEGQQAKYEAVMRKEVLTSAVVGLVGLLAPFIFVMLLGSRGH